MNAGTRATILTSLPGRGHAVGTGTPAYADGRIKPHLTWEPGPADCSG